MLTRRSLVFGAALMAAGPAAAHHGWRWAEDGQFELEGVIRDIYLGYPHATLEVDAGGEMWTVELGPPSRTESAGIREGVLETGQEVLASGHRSKDADQRVMKAERITVAGKLYDIYPNRS